MTLASGSRLGPYEIVAPLGAGGMGEVYRARDTRLNRQVAVKVLPDSLARDPEALARFEREAQAVAALSHPNILAIHDFADHEARVFAVTELLQGETLREMLSGGPLPLRKTIDFSRQICSGLAAAHAAGIVHRDLKPDNIFVTHDGRVKILDFGLAKPVVRKGSVDETHSPTVSAYTEPGTVMGTVGYMSPEQVKARDVDHRSDIFSFGAVLYEMLTGKRAFQRETSAETMTAVLREDPPEPSETGRAFPGALDRVVRHCLEKKPEQRFQSASDIAFALEETSGAFPAKATPAPQRAGRAAIFALLGAAAGLLAGFPLGRWWGAPAEAEPPRVHPLTFSGRDNDPAASPDGKLVAFTSWRDGESRIWIKQLSGGGEAPLTSGPDRRPRFSPDGDSLLFLRDVGATQTVYRVGLVGGEPRPLIEDVIEADWSPDGKKIAFFRPGKGSRPATRFGVFDVETGKETVLATLNELEVYSARWSPDGRTIGFSEGNVNRNSAQWRLRQIDVTTGRVSPLGPDRRGYALGGLAWSGNGRHLFYIQTDSIMGDIAGSESRVFDLDRSSNRVRSVLWEDGLAAINASAGEVSRCDVLSRGRLVFAKRLRRQNLREVPLGGRARATGPRLLTEGSSIDRQPTYSPDGKRVLFSSNRSGNLDLWMMDLGTGALRQVTDDRAQDWDPSFTPDGKHILWDSDRTGHLEVWIANLDGSAARQVTQDGVDAENPTETPDGQWILYWSGNAQTRGVWKIHPDGSGAARLLETDAVGTDVSPDGRYVLFVEQDRMRLRNTVRFVDTASGRPVAFAISTPFTVGAPGIIYGRARWARDGKSVYYVAQDAAGLTGVFVQDFVPGTDTSASRRPVAGFSAEYVTESLGLSPDGTQLTISTGEEFASIMVADNVPGAEAPVRKAP
jgi:Tol biopolymer transport system component